MGNTKVVSQQPSKALGLDGCCRRKLRGVAPGPDAFPWVLASVSLIVILSVHESAFSLQTWPTRKLAHREEMCVVFLGSSQKNVSC